MSAVNVFVQPNSIVVATDGMVALAGHMVLSVTKTFALPKLDAIIAFRCNSLSFAHHVIHLLDLRYQSYDDMKAELSTKGLPIPWFYRLTRRHKIELCVAGIDGVGELDAYRYQSVAAFGNPAGVVDIEFGAIAPLDDDALLDEVDAWLGTLPLSAVITRVMDRQRIMSDARGVSAAVGAFCQVTTVEREESAAGAWRAKFTTRIIKRYADEIGKPIAATDESAK